MTGIEFDHLANMSVDELERLQKRLLPKRKTLHDKLSAAEYAFMQLEGRLQTIARLIIRKKAGTSTQGLRP